MVLLGVDKNDEFEEYIQDIEIYLLGGLSNETSMLWEQVRNDLKIENIPLTVKEEELIRNLIERNRNC